MMTDMAMTSHATSGASAERAAVLQKLRGRDTIFYWMTRIAAVSVLGMLGAIMISLIIGAWPAISTYGLSFISTVRWAPNAMPTPILGGLSPLIGTLITSVVALLIAVPVGLGIAIFLTELCPPRLMRPISIAIEMLAGIPSIIYGMWGFFVLGPFLAERGLGGNLSLLNASLILAIMVLPFITAISRDVFATVPPVLKEAAYGVGCTTWEVVRNVVLPYTRVGIIGGVMLALGRALGETMAVTFVVGNSFRLPTSLFSPGTTISAAIASEFAESADLHQSALILLGLLLFVLTFCVLAVARLMLARLAKKAGA
jgi:phosphate transport system permease protein